MGLLVAGGAIAQLVLEALALIQRIVDLRVGVPELLRRQVDLEPAGESGIVEPLLGERGGFDRKVGDEGGRDQCGLCVDLVQLLDQSAERRLLVCVEGRADASARVASMLQGIQFLRRDSGVPADSLQHGQAGPGPGAQVDLCAAPGEGGSAVQRRADRDVHLLDELHDVIQVHVGLVELHEREFGIVPGGNSLVAEYAADLVHLFESADDEPFEIELDGDAKLEVVVQRVVVRCERPRRGASGDDLKHGRLDLQKPALVQKSPHCGHDPAAGDQRVARFGIGVQIEIPVTVSVLLVGQSAVNDAGLVRLAERDHPEGLRQQCELLDVQRALAHARDEGEAAHADDVAQVQVVEIGERLVADLVLSDVELQPSALVADVGEGDLALRAMRDDPAGCGELKSFALRVRQGPVRGGFGDDLRGRVGSFEALVAERICAARLKLAQSGQPLFALVFPVFGQMIDGVCIFGTHRGCGRQIVEWTGAAGRSESSEREAARKDGERRAEERVTCGWIRSGSASRRRARESSRRRRRAFQGAPRQTAIRPR